MAASDLMAVSDSDSPVSGNIPRKHSGSVFLCHPCAGFCDCHSCRGHGNGVRTLAATAGGFLTLAAMIICPLFGSRTDASANKFPIVKTVARTMTDSEAKRMTGAASRRTIKAARILQSAKSDGEAPDHCPKQCRSTRQPDKDGCFIGVFYRNSASVVVTLPPLRLAIRPEKRNATGEGVSEQILAHSPPSLSGFANGRKRRRQSVQIRQISGGRG